MGTIGDKTLPPKMAKIFVIFEWKLKVFSAEMELLEPSETNTRMPYPRHPHQA